VAAIFVPLILVYQSWTYHVFRARVGGGEVGGGGEAVAPPASRSPAS
jgi:cytochrome d ubiquinol oxidase subunit II